MKFLRRSATSTVDADPVEPEVSETSEDTGQRGHTPGKGRPTRKRRDAEGRRRGPAPAPPRTQREASRRAKENRPTKEQRRAMAQERRERMAAGDDRYLMPRDKGPVKAYIRDVVDSRPHLMGLFMPLALVVVVSGLTPIPAAQAYMSTFSMVVLATMIVEGVFLGISVTRRVRERFPDEEVKGLAVGWYAFTRASQLRRLRIPKPRVQRGANP